MNFSNAEIDVLRLCAWCKDLPAHGCRNIPAEILDSLVQYRLIRLSRNKLGYRCTPEGIAVLESIGMSYGQDKSYRTNRDVLARRYQTAEVTSFFWRYGADVFAEAPPTETQNNIFMPSFTLRRQQHANILGGTMLTGFYYTQDTVFIPYFVSREADGIYPNVEQRTFRADILLQGRKPHIMYTGDGDQKTLAETVSFKRERSKKVTTTYYKDAMDQFHCPVSIVPMDTDGMRQLRILSVPDYRQKLIKNILRDNYLPPTSPLFDGRTKTENFIIGFDCNLLRFENAVRSKGLTNIFVLPSQIEFVQNLLDDTNTKIFVIEFKDAENFFGLPHTLPAIDRTPFQTGKGSYVDVPLLGKTKKTGR